MPEHLQTLRDRAERSVRAKQALLDGDELEQVAAFAPVVVQSLRDGHHVFFFGNGGSSMDAGHLAAELLGRYYRDRRPLGSVALSDNTAAMTAIGNDYSYGEVFSRQITGLGRPGDVAVGLTTSGNSENVVMALETARANGLVTIAFTGESGGKAADVAEYVFRAPSGDTPRIQEMHMLVGHTLCEIIEMELFPDS
jgi:D-sedoheptulose 7-phosphate isomerase